MSDQTETPAVETRVLNQRWDVAEIERMEAAAQRLSAREHFPVTVTDIMRRAVRREVEAILAESEAAS